MKPRVNSCPKLAAANAPKARIPGPQTTPSGAQRERDEYDAELICGASSTRTGACVCLTRRNAERTNNTIMPTAATIPAIRLSARAVRKSASWLYELVAVELRE